MIENHSHWQDFIEWIHEHWPMLSTVSLFLAGSFWYVLHKTFASHKKVNVCKSDLTKALKDHEVWADNQSRLKSDENSKQHAEIRVDLAHVRKELGDLKSILIKGIK